MSTIRATPPDGPSSQRDAASLFDVTGGGEMAQLMRGLDWSSTALGPVDGWPPSLRAAVRTVLASRYPMLICWGPEYVQLYNDAYRPVLGATKHPEALGQSSRECWPEIWHVIGPMFDRVMAKDAATWDEDMLFVLERNRYVEETYFTFSYSALPDDADGVGGVLVTCVETTARVLGERRLRTLRALAENASSARSIDEACRAAAEVLARNDHDVAFALFYVLGEGDHARLAATTRLPQGSPLAPFRVPLHGAAGRDPWPLAEVVRSGEPLTLSGLAHDPGSLPGGAWPEAADIAHVVPVGAAGGDRPAAVLIAGASPRRIFDDDYRGFLELVAGHLEAAIGSARAYEQQRQRAEALAELDRLKTEFFSNVSHEFRTPLTLILGPLEEVLGSAVELSPRAREALLTVERNALRLLRLVNTLLDFSRIEAGRMEAELKAVDLSTLTTDLASTFRSAFERAGVELVVDCPPAPFAVEVDAGMWEKIVLNLLSNALKFTFEGAVHLSLREEGDGIRLDVRDTGLGIPAADLPYLFDRFYRVRTSRARTYEGSGIGLALVRELTRLHGGEVTATSRERRGSTFTVRLPAARRASIREASPDGLESAPTGIEARPYLEEALSWLGVRGAAELPQAAVEVWWPGSTRPDALAKFGGEPTERAPRILVADDNADMRDYFARLLGGRWSVVLARDGVEALEAVRKELPELVVADVMMPRMDGFELLEALRADPRTRDVSILLLSARAGEESRVKGLEAGADDYLVKPFSPRELVARVGAQLELTHLRRESERRLREIVSRVTDGFWTLDREWNVTFVNVHGATLLDAEPEELVGKNLLDLFPELVGTSFHRAQQRALDEQVFMCVEDYYEPLDTWFETRIYPSPSGLTLFHTDVTDRQRAAKADAKAREELEREVARRTGQLRSLSRRLMTIQETERKKLARALHDSVGQTLTAVSMSLQRLTHMGPPATDELQYGLDLVAEGIRQVQEASLELRPPALDTFGVASALRWYIEQYAARVDYKVSFESETDDRFPPQVETACYRVAQEALTNVARHAEPTRVSVRLRRPPGALELEIRDDGRGFDASGLRDEAAADALGLVGMREMASLADGELTIDSKPGRGTTVRARFPVPEPSRTPSTSG